MANPSKVLARVERVESFGEGVYQVTFAAPSRFTKYLPGQFLHLTLEEYDPTSGYWPESRVFSIASEPRQDHVVIVYSVKGTYTKRMEKELEPGREIWLKFPYGHFIIGEESLAAGPVVLIAGGTGISPYLPFLMKPKVNQNLVHLFYGVRRPEHLLFRQSLIELSALPWFRLNLTVEDGVMEGLPYESGRLSMGMVFKSLGSDLERAEIFLSGPPGMIRSFQAELLTNRIHDSQIHVDEWE